MRCLIVDDSAAFGAAARAMLSGSGIEVIGTAATATEALRQTRSLRPDLVLVDIDLGTENGFDVAADIHRQIAPHPAIIMISTHDREDFVELTAASPALGFVSKMMLSAPAIRALISGTPDT